MRKIRPRRVAVHVRRVSRHTGRWAWYASAATLALLAVLFTAARILLPMVEDRKSDLERYLSRKSAHQVRIEKLDTFWDGMYPGARIQGLHVYTKDQLQPAVSLGELRLSLALLPLLWGKIEIHSLVLVRPSLAFERLADGRFRISGFDPIRLARREGDEKFTVWLFAQDQLAIVDGEMQWFDHRAPAAAGLSLTRVNITLNNDGDRHRLGFSARFPPGVCGAYAPPAAAGIEAGDCSLLFDIRGNPFLSNKWDGEIYLRAGEVNIDALPLIAREKLPPDFRGRFAAQLWSKWKSARPRLVQGEVSVSGLRLPLPALRAPLAVRQASTELKWEAGNDGWRLELDDLALGLSGPSWRAGRLLADVGARASTLQIGHLDVGDLTQFATNLRIDHPLFAHWAALSPAGAVDRLNLRVTGAAAAPEDFHAEADIAGLRTRPYEDFPGVQGLSGRLSARRHTGEFLLDAKDFTLLLPRVFRGPIEAERLAGRLDWERKSDHWQVRGADLRLEGADGRGTGALLLRLPDDRARSQFLKLRVDFHDGDVARAARYFPASHLKPATLAWMERSFLGGRVVSGHLIYEGETHAFPFDNGGGIFEIRARARDAVYNYLPGWEPVRNADLDVTVRGSSVLVTGHGTIGGVEARQVVARAEHPADGGGYVVRVGARLGGAVNEYLAVLRDVRAAGRERWQSYLPAALRGSGDGALSLDITIPAAAHRPAGVRGEYYFLDAGLRLGALAVEGIRGGVQFTGAGLQSGDLRARFLDGDAVVAMATRDTGRFQIFAQGKIPAGGLAPLLGPRLAPRIVGAADWSAGWRGAGGAGDLHAEIDLNGLKSTLPPPLHRPDGLTAEKLILKTETRDRRNHVIAVRAGSEIAGRLEFARDRGFWRLARGRVGFGEERVALPGEDGLQLKARIEALDLDQWLPLFADAGGAVEPPPFLWRVSADIGALDLLDRRFGRMAVDLAPRAATAADGGGWSGGFRGPALAGTGGFYRRQGVAHIWFDLARLNLPDKKHRGTDTEVDPARLPAVNVRSRSFQLKGRQLGELDFAAAPMERGWRIARLKLTRPEMKLAASGRWRRLDDRHESEFEVSLKDSDMGKTLEALGFPGQMSSGEVDLNARLSWPGSPTNIKPAGVSGRIAIAAEDGRFLQLKQGAGRMFGLLDLGSIGRYLMLDFSAAFGKGFVFNKITGGIDVDRGNANTRDLSIRGPSAQIGVVGRVGLVAEDFDLVIEVQPRLTSSLTLTTWGLWGPQVAAWVLAMQQIFKKQISAGTRVTYVVKGPWADPTVTKSELKAAPKAEAPPAGE